MTSALISDNTLTAADAPAGGTRPGRPVAHGTMVRRPYLAPVPDCEPPFDDERSAVSRLQQLRAAAKSTMSLATAPGGGRLATAGRVRNMPDTIQDAEVPGWSQDPDIGVRRTATAELPAATRSAQVLARALVEVLSGQRPLAQLRVHCAPDVFAGLQDQHFVGGALGHLLNVRVCEPADGVAEVSVVFRRAERVRALAFRIQGVDGRWRVTALQTG